MTILLRTMTLLSKFIGGKYKDQKVETVLKLNAQYIRYEYFYMSNISFTEDVLIAAGITNEYRIKKPGTDKEMSHKYNVDKLNAMTDSQKIKHFIDNKKKRIRHAKLLFARHINDEKMIFSKQSLKNLNNQTKKLDLSYRTVDGKKFSKPK